MTYTLKQRLGALLFDVPSYLYLLCRTRPLNGGAAWLQVRNRDQSLEISEKPFGVKCQWKWTSDLYLPKVFPFFSKKLFAKALQAYPIKLSGNSLPRKSDIEVSFIIGHRGTSRIQLLLKTIDAISNQSACMVECIIVEQDHTPIVREFLPSWVKYIFTPVADANMAYSRAWAFNEGAKHAAGDCLIFHDNDLLIPQNYAIETYKRFKEGYDFINLKRFIFYLSKSASAQLISSNKILPSLEIESIMQNAEGGGSIGASKTAFNKIGRFDQRFVGWGSEDNEFWERAQTQTVWEFGYLPLIHLWHQAQVGKLNNENRNTKVLYDELSKLSPQERIASLTIDQ